MLRPPTRSTPPKFIDVHTHDRSEPGQWEMQMAAASRDNDSRIADYDIHVAVDFSRGCVAQ
jgi:hypothetical protein